MTQPLGVVLQAFAVETRAYWASDIRGNLILLSLGDVDAQFLSQRYCKELISSAVRKLSDADRHHLENAKGTKCYQKKKIKVFQDCAKLG
jgi:hypothetical protein